MPSVGGRSTEHQKKSEGGGGGTHTGALGLLGVGDAIVVRVPVVGV